MICNLGFKKIRRSLYLVKETYFDKLYSKKDAQNEYSTISILQNFVNGPDKGSASLIFLPQISQNENEFVITFWIKYV